MARLESWNEILRFYGGKRYDSSGEKAVKTEGYEGKTGMSCNAVSHTQDGEVYGIDNKKQRLEHLQADLCQFTYVELTH